MIIVDGHCDTITRLMETGENLYRNGCHADLCRMKQYNGFVQFFAAFIEPVYGQAYSVRWAFKVIDNYYSQLSSYNSIITPCLSYNDIMNAIAHEKIAAVLSIEDGVVLQGEISSLRMFYRMGVRSICLTWNYRNDIADGVLDESAKGGLTPFGREVVAEMNRLGMLIDVSHISESGFWDVIETTTSPVMASHSNARKICNNPRNLSDAQIRAIKQNNGVIGINLCADFLSERNVASVADVIRHIEHICEIAGEDYVGFGCDFDGIKRTPVSINSVEDIRLIIDELLRLNYSDATVEKIAGGNFLRVIRNVLL